MQRRTLQLLGSRAQLRYRSRRLPVAGLLALYGLGFGFTGFKGFQGFLGVYVLVGAGL